MISFDYKPQGVCARNIHLDLSDDGNKVVGVEFTGGCDGNLKAISKLVEGAPALLFDPEDEIPTGTEVVFTNLNARPYVGRNGRIAVTASAEACRLANQPRGKE